MFLASDESRYITGQLIAVDGGMGPTPARGRLSREGWVVPAGVYVGPRTYSPVRGWWYQPLAA